MKKQITLLLMLFIAFASRASVPTITSFQPDSGAVGTLVTITGTNLDSITAFTIGGATAIVLSDSGTKVLGMIMPGAITGAISITTTRGTVTAGNNFIVTPTIYPGVQQGAKLADSSVSGTVFQGWRVALSADGNTAIVGGVYYNSHKGAVWIYTRSGTAWAQQGPMLTGSDATAGAMQGSSVALSADGNTAIVGGYGDSSSVGAAWIYCRKNNIWKQNGPKLCATDATANASQGLAVALSADGNTAIVGGPQDNTNAGAVWVYTRTTDTTWTQLGPKLYGIDNSGNAFQGASVAISSDGNTFIEGGTSDNLFTGAVWVFVKSHGNWIQQGPKLVGMGGTGIDLGSCVAISSDGNTIIAGDPGYNNQDGAVWIFTRTDTIWRQQGNMLTGSGAIGVFSNQGSSVSISADGNVAIWGGSGDNNNAGATWVFTRTDTTWTQRAILKGSGALGGANQGKSVALSADGTTAIIGGPDDNQPASTGAAWIFATAQPLTASYIADSVSCANVCNATAVINVAGGQAPYYYLWNTITHDTTDSVSNLCSGAYIVTVHDAIGYNVVVNVSIGQKPAPVSFDTVTICAGMSYLGHNQTGIFTDTLTGTNGCDSLVTLMLTVMPLPLITIPADTTICSGSYIILSASSSADTLSWLGGYANGQSVVVTQPTSFVIRAATGICAITDTLMVTTDTVAGNLLNSSTTVCAGDTVALSAAGGSSYSWYGSVSGSIATGPTAKLIANSSEVVSVQIQSANGCILTDSFTVTVIPEKVWPGDANEDLVANNFDILYIGIAYGTTGPVRPDASLAWQKQCAPAWSDSFTNGTNYAFADCNGDGVIDYADTDAVILNYGQLHTRGSASRSGNFPLIVHCNFPAYHAGDTVTGQLLLGTTTIPVTGYGIAVTIDPGSIAIPNSLNIDQNSSWLTSGQGQLSIIKPVTPVSDDIAQTRTNHINVTGYGAIASFSFMLDNNVSAGNPFYVNISNVLCMNSHGDTLGLNIQYDSIVVINGIRDLTINSTISLYPNPATNRLFIETDGPVISEIHIYDAVGNLIFTTKQYFNNGLDISNLTNGVYIAEIITNQGAINKLWVKM